MPDKELTLDNLKEEVSAYIRRICIDRRMCAESNLDLMELDTFITSEMRRLMKEMDEMPIRQFCSMLLKDLLENMEQ